MPYNPWSTYPQTGGFGANPWAPPVAQTQPRRPPLQMGGISHGPTIPAGFQRLESQGPKFYRDPNGTAGWMPMATAENPDTSMSYLDYITQKVRGQNQSLFGTGGGQNWGQVQPPQVTPQTYGGAPQMPQVSIDQYGRQTRIDPVTGRKQYYQHMQTGGAWMDAGF